MIELQSHIDSSLKRASLLRGTALAFIGASLILYCGAFLSANTLKVWGLPIFLLGLALICLGLLPYRRLCQLELNPYQLALDDTKLSFSRDRRLLFTIPLSLIGKASYLQRKTIYGICLWIKQPLPNTNSFQKRSLKKYGCDFFFPYFGKRAYDALKKYFHQERRENISYGS